MPGRKLKRKPVSQAQRRAMFAAKAGHSTLDIPKDVGAEYAGNDPGGKLPEYKHKKVKRRRAA